MSSVLQEAIRQLSVADKILLVEELWDQIAQTADSMQLPESQRQELERRYQEFLQNPREGSPWTEVKQRLLG